MQLQQLGALIVVELKKLWRDPMNLAVLLLMPVGLTVILWAALGSVSNDYYPVPGLSHFEYLLPGIMGYAVIYMGMMVALSLVEYRNSALLSRVEVTPTSPVTVLGSQIIANMVIAVVQGLIVLALAVIFGFRPQGGVVGILLAVPFLALLAVTAVGLGLIVAAISKESGSAGGLSVIFILPMMMFGSWLAVFNKATLTIAKFMPNHYVTATFSKIYHEGLVGDPSVWQNFLILLAIGLVVVVIGVQVFRRTSVRFS
jgi:ABC-2 type transport system permease protein